MRFSLRSHPPFFVNLHNLNLANALEQKRGALHKQSKLKTIRTFAVYIENFVKMEQNGLLRDSKCNWHVQSCTP